MMKILTVALAVAALIAGLKAAYEWHKASGVVIDLGYIQPGLPPTYRRMGVDFLRTPESGEPEEQRMNEMAATWEAIQESSRINKSAAVWTAGAVALSATAPHAQPIVGFIE
jgi:hypothetical protein